MVQFTGAVFYQVCRDKQIQGTVSTGLFGLLQRLDNVPKSHIFGVEADVTVRPLEGLTLIGSASYLKSEVDRYSGTSVFEVETDFAGSPLPFAPEWTLIGDIDYRVPVASGGNMSAETRWRSPIMASTAGPPGFPSRSMATRSSMRVWAMNFPESASHSRSGGKTSSTRTMF